MINFQRLHYFCVMVEEGGIHRAARRLGLSQPPLSMALKDLEAELGCQLIFRQGRNWILTDAGRRLYEEGRDILARATGLSACIRQPDCALSGVIRCGFSTSCPAMFEKVLPKLASTYPQVSTHVLFSDSERLARYVRQRLIDMAVLYLPLAESDFNIAPLKPQRLIAVFSPLIPAPPPGEMDLATICSWPLLLPRRWNGGGIYAIFARAIQKYGFEPRIICQSQDSYLLRPLLASIAAVAVMPQCEADFSATYEERLIKELSEPLIPAVITLKNTWLSLPVQKMMEFVISDFGQG